MLGDEGGDDPGGCRRQWWCSGDAGEQGEVGEVSGRSEVVWAMR